MKVPLTNKSMYLRSHSTITLTILLIFIAATTRIHSRLLTTTYGPSEYFALESLKQTTAFTEMEAQANATLLAAQYAHELNMNKAAADAEWRLKKPCAAEHADQVEKSKATMKAQHAPELRIKQINSDAEWQLRKAESAERVQKSRIAAEALEAVAKKGAVINGSSINVRI